MTKKYWIVFSSIVFGALFGYMIFKSYESCNKQKELTEEQAWAKEFIEKARTAV